jgi:hypothetical protein
VGELIAALARCPILFQDSIHGPSRAKIAAFIEQSGMDGCGRTVLEAFGIQQSANRCAFGETQRTRRDWPGDRYRERNGQGWTEQGTLSVEGSSGDSKHVTGRLDSNR